MMIPEEIMFILLLANLQPTRNAGVNALSIAATTSSLNNTTMSSTIFINKSSNKSVTSGRTPSVTLTSPTDTDDNTTKNMVMESSTQSSSVTLLNTWLSSTAHQLNLTTKDSNQTSAIINGTSAPSEMPTVSSGLFTISENYSVTTYINSTEKAMNNSTTANYNVSSTTIVSSNGTQIDGITVHPTSSMSNTSTMSPGTKINSVTTALRISLQTTSLYSSFTDGLAEAREPQKENHSNGAVVFGAIVGAILGCALISLVGYFMCGKRKTDSFAHQRLYDDMRNDPVLRLDNVHEPYGASFGNLSYYSPTTVNETAAQSSKESPYDAIQMNDMSASQPSAQ
ncbi:mucin-15 [Podarcis raffonei]|uniref:mucin-15 n=1 Tax=Podarcis raffonei TaxID=65483 RepID=UPI0023293E2E|nr:mucin-15 [Podarcis raffonei]